jgi:putative radical SAM enzyme (TIGR03279 family)
VSTAVITAVAAGSPAAEAGVLVGDELRAISGRPVRDVIEYRVLGDEPDVDLELRRGDVDLVVEVRKPAGVPLGIEVDSPLFDGIRTCDNHCEFCFIYQLPPGMRRSLYVKDDDYRLSFLYGNFTTLTRFTEADLERVVVEGLSPLYVSIHATEPSVRSDLLRNRRGATSLRWLRALLDHGVEVHGQVVVCPGLNDGPVLADTLCGVLDEFPEIADLAVVPLGVSDHNPEPRMRPHSRDEALAVVRTVEAARDVFRSVLGRPVVFAADEYYLLAGLPFPAAEEYGQFAMHEDGIGMARAFELEFTGARDEVIGVQPGFFASVDGAPATGYRAPRGEPAAAAPEASRSAPAPEPTHAPDGTGAPDGTVAPGRTDPSAVPGVPVGILTGTMGAAIIEPLVATLGRSEIRVIPVENRFFGGNIGVSGLMVGQDLAQVLSREPVGHRYLLPDVCLSRGVFLDGVRPEDLPRPVEVIPTDGRSLRAALEAAPVRGDRVTGQVAS